MSAADDDMVFGCVRLRPSARRRHSDLNYALLLNVVPRAGRPEIAATVAEIMPVLKLRATKSRREALAVMVANLFNAWATIGAPFLGVPLRKSDYAPGSRLAALWLAYRPVSDVVRALHTCGYVELHAGVYSQELKRRTRIRALDKLTRLFLRHRLHLDCLKLADESEVVLHGDKDDEGVRRRIDISRGKLAASAKPFREGVRRINEALSSAKIELYVEEDVFIQHFIAKRIGKKNPVTPPSPLHNRFRRVFNCNFDLGGRFYAHWCQGLPRELRRHILINGEPIQELDFKALHPSLLYAEAGLPAPTEVYLPEGWPTKQRNAFKVLMLSALNAETEAAAIKGTRRGILTNYPELLKRKDKENILTNAWLHSALSALKDMHAPIARHFCSGVGTRLQNVDSRIASHVMHELLDQGIVALCEHDSFLVAVSHVEELRRAMYNASVAVCGVPISVDAKYAIHDQLTLSDHALIEEVSPVMDTTPRPHSQPGFPHTIGAHSEIFTISAPQRVSGGCA